MKKNIAYIVIIFLVILVSSEIFGLEIDIAHTKKGKKFEAPISIEAKRITVSRKEKSYFNLNLNVVNNSTVNEHYTWNCPESAMFKLDNEFLEIVDGICTKSGPSIHNLKPGMSSVDDIGVHISNKFKTGKIKFHLGLKSNPEILSNELEVEVVE